MFSGLEPLSRHDVETRQEVDALDDIIELRNLGRGGSTRRVIGGLSTNTRSVTSEDFARK